MKKRENESRNHFIWRIYEYNKHTAMWTDEQVGEICRKELGEDFTESAYRKKYQSFIDMWEDVQDEYVQEEGVSNQLKELDVKQDELYKSKVKYADKIREYKTLLRSEARIENLKDCITDAISCLPNIEIKEKTLQLNGDLSAILSLSDWHWGMIADNYWNKYNTSIAKQRVDTLIYETIKYCSIMNVGTIYVANLSDLINGNIHVTTRVQSEEDVLEQSMHVAEVLAYTLKEFESYGLEVKYSSVTDNHGRTNAFKEHIEKENFGRIIDWYLQARLENSTIEIIDNYIDESISLLEIDGKNIFGVHGHLDKPNQVLQTLALGIQKTPHIVLMGHYHNRQEFSINGCKVFINGSLCGVDEYSKSNRYLGKPSQNLIVLDKENVINIEIAL